MLTYLHDIRNKLTLISGQTVILSKKYGEEDFLPIRINLVRISEIINDAYRQLSDNNSEKLLYLDPQELMRQLDLMTETAQLLFPANFVNEVSAYIPKKDYKIEFSIGHIFQVIENAIDNSLKANSTKIIIRLFETSTHCIYELVDNGTGKSPVESSSIESSSIIPHGIGKEIMMQNMQRIGGKIEWTRRLGNDGMIVRLYFPKH